MRSCVIKYLNDAESMGLFSLELNFQTFNIDNGWFK